MHLLAHGQHGRVGVQREQVHDRRRTIAGVSKQVCQRIQQVAFGVKRVAHTTLRRSETGVGREFRMECVSRLLWMGRIVVVQLRNALAGCHAQSDTLRIEP